MKLHCLVQAGRSYVLRNLPPSPTEHRGVEEGDRVEIKATGPDWCDVEVSQGRTFRVFSGEFQELTPPPQPNRTQ